MHRNRRVFMVRQKVMDMDDGTHTLQVALQENVLMIGWRGVNVAEILSKGESEEELKKELRNALLDEGYEGHVDISYSVGALWRFGREMQVGDYVVVPHEDHFYVAEVAGPAFYLREAFEYDSANRRPVWWLNRKQPIPRRLASPELQSFMRNQQTIIGPREDLVEHVEEVLEKAVVERLCQKG